MNKRFTSSWYTQNHLKSIIITWSSYTDVGLRRFGAILLRSRAVSKLLIRIICATRTRRTSGTWSCRIFIRVRIKSRRTLYCCFAGALGLWIIYDGRITQIRLRLRICGCIFRPVIGLDDFCERVISFWLQGCWLTCLCGLPCVWIPRATFIGSCSWT